MNIVLTAATVMVFILMSSTFCYTGEKYTDVSHYYRYIKDNTAPYEPIDEINYEEANNLYVYYEAYYNKEGRVSSLKKYVRGKLEWTEDYTYGVTGQIEDRKISLADKK
ncbi:MAG: hypothetical protein A3G39_02505 [Deltaproteobacteria bacterium RIFCSPLOWO2_12_FULL_43_16]|nr:MAG: hypothetical protein A2Z89_01015 [Deltaproteobacteria bacterium GWA2_43_19]OGQ09768.1 MAG: hypothetical protein A3D30_05530 [Deltaproteobacteria bacterium RIFCSPHIGHO2_02_FULL_43_33]OGQ58923.1 MAG: hypothetical protein A3G39_02505 [Deltaproteobacteria bacterium RIFCSPLOWO2_12_FULL_43_16]HBR17690.1 hypothetical protein [Deltaproteobacteria bacterium]